MTQTVRTVRAVTGDLKARASARLYPLVDKVGGLLPETPRASFSPAHGIGSVASVVSGGFQHDRKAVYVTGIAPVRSLNQSVE
jgi:hypothetical protein